MFFSSGAALSLSLFFSPSCEFSLSKNVVGFHDHHHHRSTHTHVTTDNEQKNISLLFSSVSDVEHERLVRGDKLARQQPDLQVDLPRAQEEQAVVVAGRRQRDHSVRQHYGQPRRQTDRADAVVRVARQRVADVAGREAQIKVLLAVAAAAEAVQVRLELLGVQPRSVLLVLFVFVLV